MTHWYFIEPCDVWMFRDSKPFAAGQSFVARSQFPPTPQTMQGVVRSAYLEERGVDWQAYGAGRIATAVGTPSTLGDFEQFGPLVGRRETGETGKVSVVPFIPSPLDLVHSKSGSGGLMLLAPSRDNRRVVTSEPFSGWLPLAPQAHGNDLEHAPGWLGKAALETYVKGNVPAALESSDSLFVHEDRVGLAMDHGRRTHREHHLYHAQFVRLNSGVGLIVGTNGPYLPQNGIINIGGESRSGYCEAVHVSLPTGPTSGRIKVVLLTPAYFTGGWAPADGDWSPWVGDGRLVSMAIGRPQPISGWDVANRRPKPLNQYVPVGSVYYFENAEWKGHPFTETPDAMLDHQAAGFGGALTAPWTYVN